VAQRKRRDYHREYYYKRYHGDATFRSRLLERNNCYREKHPNRMGVQNKLHYAVYSGLISKQPCFVCGITDNVHAHHEDYNRPYDVVWLCPKHHRRVHLGEIEL
jgi:hypothetical protein